MSLEEEDRDSGDEQYPPDVDYDTEYLIQRGREHSGSSRRAIRINRERMDEETFEKGFKPSKRKATLLKKFIEKITPPEPIKTALKPPLSRKEWLKFFLVRLPILEWVWTYRPSYFVGDIISGITVAIMHIPQGLAYSLLATLPAVYGLYASVVPVVVYSVLGTSKHISVGTFAVVELMIGNAIQRTLDSLGYSQCTGGSGNLTDTQVLDIVVDNVTNATCGSIKIDIALTLALMTGLIMVRVHSQTTE